MQPQRILIINRHFWPDVSTYGQMLRLIGARLCADGHAVDVFTAKPSYRPEAGVDAAKRERCDGMNIYRMCLLTIGKGGLFSRLINILPFFFGLLWHVLKCRLAGTRYDLMLVATNPPILEALLAYLMTGVGGGKIIYHVQDIHPEVEVSAGLFKSDGWVARFLLKIDAFVCKKSAAVITLSADMKTSLSGRNPSNKIETINNFIVDQEAEGPLPAELAASPAKFRLIFAGNIGYFQGLEQIVSAMQFLSDLPEIELVFVGNGVALSKLKRQASSLPNGAVTFVPFQPASVAQAMIADSDLAIVCLKPGVIRLAYPSKTMTYAATGTPILAMVENDCELASTIGDNKLGYVASQNEPEQIAGIVKRAWENRATLRGTRADRQKRGRELFGASATLDKWSQLVARLSERT